MCGITACIALDAKRCNASTRSGTSHANSNGSHDADPQSIRSSRREYLQEQLSASLQKIVHRGPDAQGTWVSDGGYVGLGHVRLAINDLDPRASQPFHHSPSETTSSQSASHGPIHAIVNGELYDHDTLRTKLAKPPMSYPFRSTSDCEIVLALYIAYGPSFLSHLRGEFALVLYDEDRKLLIAARDRYGIKPLFWTEVEGRLWLGAEIKAFLGVEGWEPEWDVRALRDGGWGHDERTVFKGVQKLRPGHYLMCHPFGNIEIKPYWDIEYPDKNVVETRTEEEMVEGVRHRLLEAVRLRLRADVPVGIYLSGGIDSSVLAGMATHLVKEGTASMGSQDPSERICCFSIAFDEESGMDESDISNRTASWLNVKYMKKLMNEQELAARLEDATYHCEHQNYDLNYVGKFALSELVRENGYKVVLTGEGADENFGGYPLYQPDFLFDPDPSWPSNSLDNCGINTTLLQQKKQMEIEQMYSNLGVRVRSAHVKDVGTRQLSMLSTPSYMLAFDPPMLLFQSWVESSYGALEPLETIANNIDNRTKAIMEEKWHPLHAAQYIWSKGHLANNFLSCLGDRTEMAHSIEARTPFLDHHLTQYVNSLPPSLKIKYTTPEETQASAGASQPNGTSNKSDKHRHKRQHVEPSTSEGKFTEKYILREAARPFITDELYTRTKHAYAAATSYPRDGPLHRKFSELVTKDNVDALGFVEWDVANGLLREAFDEELSDRMRAGALRLVLMVSQWVVLGQRFGIRKAGKGEDAEITV